MTYTCIIKNEETDKTDVVVVRLPGFTERFSDDVVFSNIQSGLGDDELLLDYYDGGVTFRNLTDLKRVGHQWILDTVSNYYGIPVDEFLHNDPERRPRKAIKVRCRTMCYKMMVKYSGMALTHIGTIFSKRHHSSVINGLRQYDDLIETDEVFKIEAAEIEEQIISKVS